jgi:hypothetical protein
MYRNFMIGFMYEGYFYCANVHRYNISPAEYHITILANASRNGLPTSIILKDAGSTLQPASKEPVPSALLNTIITEIQKRTAAN